MKKTIVIIGGGIAGLSVAHELSYYNYEIIVIERNNIFGGLARTHQDYLNKICPIEYSWRAYGKWYQNVYNVMKKIPFNQNESVFQQLVELDGGLKSCKKKIPNYVNLSLTFGNINFQDKLKLFPTFLKYVISSKERNIKNFSPISLKQFIKDNHLSPQTENIMGKIVGPYLGFDYQNASLYDLLYTVEIIMCNSSSKYKFNITKKPTNYAWFDPWIKFLKKKGVKIYKNSQVVQLNIKKNQVESIVVKFNNSLVKTTILADYYVNATGPEIFQKFIKPYQYIYPNLYSKIYNSKKYGRQIQLSVYYYIDKKIFLHKENTLAYLPNTPWLLMVLPTGHIWGDEFMNEYCHSSIKEIISVGICEPYVNGSLIKKPWSKCSKEEIKLEAWHQLMNDNDFRNNSCIQDNTLIDNIKIIDFKMWHSYKFNGKTMDTYEPKWGNNIHTAKFRPNYNSGIKNLFIAGAYTNTSTGCYSMESACESGKKVAKHICKLDNIKNNIYVHTKKRFSFTKPIRIVDKYIYNKSIYYIIGIIIIIIIIYSLF